MSAYNKCQLALWANSPFCIVQNCLVHVAAVVHQGKMYFIGSARYDEDHMRILDSQTHRWSVLSLDKTPTAYGRVLLDAYDDQLIQFGGKTGSIVAASRKQCFWVRALCGKAC